jgi:RIO-like serine/threonine protein kinase
MPNSHSNEKLFELEHELEALLKDFHRIGEILKTIRDERLYKGSYDTFETYCKLRWKFSRQRAHQFIDAYEEDERLDGIFENESQARAALTIKNEEERTSIVKEAWILSSPQAGQRTSFARELKASVDAYHARTEPDHNLLKRIQDLFMRLNLNEMHAFLHWAQGHFNVCVSKENRSYIIDVPIVQGNEPEGRNAVKALEQAAS